MIFKKVEVPLESLSISYLSSLLHQILSTSRDSVTVGQIQIADTQ